MNSRDDMLDHPCFMGRYGKSSVKVLQPLKVCPPYIQRPAECQPAINYAEIAMPIAIRTILAASISALPSSYALEACPAATIDGLDWIAGNYAGAVGPNQFGGELDQNRASTAAMVRAPGSGKVGMFETISIGEVDGSLVLHIQQFSPGFVPRTRTPRGWN